MKTPCSRLHTSLVVFVMVLSAATAEPPPPPPGAFTIVVLPDSQAYVGLGAKRSPLSRSDVVNLPFDAETRWIADNIRTQQIVFVTHVGDIVDDSRHAEWRVARTALDRLHGVVPYALAVGNHDMENDGDASLFQRYFGADRFAGFAWYGGTYEPERTAQNISGNNVNSFQLFSAGGLDFIHLGLECNAPDDVVAWADALLRRYADRLALITTHMDLGPLQKPRVPEEFVTAPKGRMQWLKIHGARGNTPAQLWEKLYRRHANLRFVFSGDQSRTQAMRISARGDAGNTVHALMSDYGSLGPLRLVRFDPAGGRVEILTYDPLRGALVETTSLVPAPAEHRFVLPLERLPPPAP